MKPEERQELEQNDLAEVTADLGQSLVPYLAWILGILVAVVLVAVFWSYRADANRERMADGWRELYAAEKEDQLQEVAVQYNDVAVGAFARLRRADLLLQKGKEAITTDRTAALRHLDEAARLYETLSKDSSSPPSVARQAAYGLAVATESKGELKPAIAAYQRVVDSYAGTDLALAAQKRVEQLNDPEAARFYDQLAKFEAPSTDLQPLLDSPAPPSSSGDAKKSVTPSVDLSDFDFKMPVPPPAKSDKPANATDAPAAKPAAPAATEPAKEEKATPPATETPPAPKTEPSPPPKTESPAPPKAETPAPPKAETLAPPKAETPAPPKAETPPAAKGSAAE